MTPPSFTFSEIDAIFLFCLSISLLMIYNMVNERKKESVLEKYFENSNDSQLNRVRKEGVLFDLSGHSIAEIAWGGILGVMIGALMTRFFLP